MEWVEQVLGPRMKPDSNPYYKAAQFVDGSTRHLGVEGGAVCKEAGVSVVFFPGCLLPKL